MGTRTQDDDVVYWSSSDFACFANNKFGFAGYGNVGSTMGWADVTGTSESYSDQDYGGTNPPKTISGNPQYDVVTAHMGESYRIPTLYDFQQLMDNVDFEFKKLNIKRDLNIDGMPSWVQGQWLWNDAMLINGYPSNVSISLKIDGRLASVITSEGDQWEGGFSYSNGILRVWRLTLNVVNTERVLRDEKGYTYKKVSNSTASGDVYGFELKSKINGNILLIPLPPSMSHGTSGEFTISWSNPMIHNYWLGELSYMKSGYAACAKFDGQQKGAGVTYARRSERMYIRPIKVILGSGEKERESYRNQIESLINTAKELINNNQILSKDLQSRIIDIDDLEKINNPKTNSIASDPFFSTIGSKMNLKALKQKKEETESIINSLKAESEQLKKFNLEMNFKNNACKNSIFNQLLSRSFITTLFDYKVSAVDLKNGMVTIRVAVVSNGNTINYYKKIWKQLNDMATGIYRNQITIDNKQLFEEIKKPSGRNLFTHYTIDKSKQCEEQYYFSEENVKMIVPEGSSILDYLPSVIRDSICVTIADFTITNSQGKSSRFNDIKTSQNTAYDIMLDSSTRMIALFGKNEEEGVMGHPAYNHIAYQNIWICPFLETDKKNVMLFFCDFQIPYSDSYTFSSNGHKPITIKPKSKHSVNIELSNEKLCTKQSVREKMMDTRNTNYNRNFPNRGSRNVPQFGNRSRRY